MKSLFHLLLHALDVLLFMIPLLSDKDGALIIYNLQTKVEACG